jgi:hypothetical protein
VFEPICQIAIPLQVATAMISYGLNTKELAAYQHYIETELKKQLALML